MSKAFTKEDLETPERDGRKRSVSGLPPGAANYMTENGAEHLRRELEELERRVRGGAAEAARDVAERIAGLREVLRDATVVPARSEAPAEVLFGTTVTVRAADGKTSRQRIVGVDETALDPEAISWCSPEGKALLGAEVGQRVQLPDGSKVTIVAISA
jgi:transcription elongation GreA/GreB family factor